MPKLSEYLFGKKPKTKKLPTMSPQQEQLFKMLISSLGGQGGPLQEAFGSLQDLLSQDSEAYDVFSAPFMRQFEEQTIPGLAERFAGFGPESGALSSSAFGQSLGAAGAGLQERLAALRGNLQQQGRSDLFSLLQTGLGQSPFAYQQKPGSQGFLTGAVGNIIGSIPQLAMAGLGG